MNGTPSKYIQAFYHHQRAYKLAQNPSSTGLPSPQMNHVQNVIPERRPMTNGMIEARHNESIRGNYGYDALRKKL